MLCCAIVILRGAPVTSVSTVQPNLATVIGGRDRDREIVHFDRGIGFACVCSRTESWITQTVCERRILLLYLVLQDLRRDTGAPPSGGGDAIRETIYSKQTLSRTGARLMSMYVMMQFSYTHWDDGLKKTKGKNMNSWNRYLLMRP